MIVKNAMTTLTLGSIMVALAGAASAQTLPPAAPGSNQTIPEKVPGSHEKLKDTQAPSTLQNGRSSSLSNKLNQSNGVIAPKSDVDPGMKMPSDSGSATPTPVIPPSATGGNNAK